MKVDFTNEIYEFLQEEGVIFLDGSKPVSKFHRKGMKSGIITPEILDQRNQSCYIE